MSENFNKKATKVLLYGIFFILSVMAGAMVVSMLLRGDYLRVTAALLAALLFWRVQDENRRLRAENDRLREAVVRSLYGIRY